MFVLFGNQVTSSYRADDTLHVLKIDGLIHLVHNGAGVLCFPIEEAVPSIKGYVTELLLARRSPDVMFHAACLVRGGRSILISGEPGAGKTTLTIHLLKAGFEYRGDDITCIAPDGTVMGIPFAPAIKSGAWKMIGRIRPDLRTAPVHKRPDGKRVRYLNVGKLAQDRKYAVDAIFFIQRRSSQPAQLEPLAQVDALRRLVAGSFVRDGKLTQQSCDAIRRTLNNARLFDLTYTDVAQACDAIAELCRE